MNRITLDLDALRASSANMQGYIEEMNTLCQRLNMQVDKMTGSWKGESSQAFTGLMADYSSRAARTVRILDAYKRYVDTAVQRFSELDRSGAVRIRGSF